VNEPLQEHAPAVIIGAGCIGASIAYHLSRRGVRGVVVLEREPFAGSGSTGKAAGGIRAQFSTPVSVRVSQLAIAHYERFAEEMGTTPVFFQVGYLFLLADESRWRAFQEQARMQRELGLPVEVWTPAEAKAHVPQLCVDDVRGATFCAKDGLGLPHEVTQAYVQRARELGARFEFDRAATGLRLRNGAIRGVETRVGAIDTPLVINAAGPHAAEVASWAGVELPVQPIRRHCFTTQPLPFVHDRLPMIVDLPSGVYMHRESGGMLLGLANPEEPPGFEVSVNWDMLPRLVEPAVHRIPALEHAEIARGWAGLYETTPDHNAVIGPVSAVPGLMLANGFSGHGFMQSPAVGELVAEWIVEGRPSIDLHPLRLERFAEQQAMLEATVI
jgi:sarcosine oxidase subunit beta